MPDKRMRPDYRRNPADDLKYHAIIEDWIRSDLERMDALRLASALSLDDWCLAAGFVRNLAWDRLHNKKKPTPLNDLDLVYHDPRDLDPRKERELESRLKAHSKERWSVKNQARMHVRNDDNPYASTRDAMSYWVEIETAVGVRLTEFDGLEIIAPFGLAKLFEFSITINHRRSKNDDFLTRIEQKNWLSIWPKLKVYT